MGDLDFGSIDPTLNQNYDVTSTLTITCSSDPNLPLRICAHICQGSGGMDATASTRYMLNGATPMLFNIYRMNISTGVWGAQGSSGNGICGSGWTSLSLAHSITSTFDSSGNYSATVTAYGRIFSGQTNLPAGIYTSSFTSAASGQNRAAAYYLNGPGPNCGSLSTSPTNFPFTARATVVPTCRVTASDLSFGTASLLNSDVDSTSSVSVTCTAGTSYAVSLDEGIIGSTTTSRLMKHASTASTVSYRMYSDAARTANWGNSATDDVEGTGSGSAVNHTVYGRVPAQAIAPEAGSYSDTVTVTITY